MALIKSSDLRTYAQEGGEPAHRTVPAAGVTGANAFLVGRRGVDLAELLPELQIDTTYHLPSRGDWSLHELLTYLLQLTGPAGVHLVSWGITENPLRQVLNMLQAGTITELHALFDSRVKLQCPNAYQLAMASGCRLRLAKCHAKLMVLTNDAWGITVSTSANLTVNERLEYYVISTHRQVADFNRNWLDLELDDAQPFENE